MQVRDVVVEAPSEGPGGAASAVVLRTDALTLRSLPTAAGWDSTAVTGSTGGTEALEALEALLQDGSPSEANVTAASEAVRACLLVHMSQVDQPFLLNSLHRVNMTPG